MARVIEDMVQDDIVIKGYGYNEIIPAMIDPNKPWRTGRVTEKMKIYIIIFLMFLLEVELVSYFIPFFFLSDN